MIRFRNVILAGITIAALFAFGCGGDDDDDNPVNPGPNTADVTINITGQNGSSSYSPSPDTVQVGQTVSWRNNDSMAHTATSDVVEFNTGNINPGAVSTPITMDTVGSFPYHCNLHSGMTGILVVQ